jgi:hypothetical protein
MHKTLQRCLVLALVFVLFGPGTGLAQQGTRYGRARGDWLPASIVGTFDTHGGARPLTLEATLLPLPLMCPACLGGEIQGTLDDGVGPGPDYLVQGSYRGDLISGRFVLVLRNPNGTVAGSMRGRFRDPFLPSGSWVARYTLGR